MMASHPSLAGARRCAARAAAVVVLLLLWPAPLACAAEEQAAQPQQPPERFILDYPPAEQFCPPIRSTFYEVTRTLMTVRGRKFRQKRNGGYGLAVTRRQNGKNLRHVGADLGWYQVGEPVFAVAAGVVRMSIGSPPRGDDTKKPRGRAAQPLMWGNFVAIEHRLPAARGTKERYVTTLYGHLGNDRRVRVGDVVQAGQVIGTVGKQSPQVNGGYKPHLHFGVREGRAAEIGATLLEISAEGQRFPVKIAALGEDEIELELPDGAPEVLRLQRNGQRLTLARRDGAYRLPARILWGFTRPDFPLVGYALSTDGWRDPVAFLKEQGAHIRPAPFLPERKQP